MSTRAHGPTHKLQVYALRIDLNLFLSFFNYNRPLLERNMKSHHYIAVDYCPYTPLKRSGKQPYSLVDLRTWEF